jgi:hypothetical protein
MSRRFLLFPDKQAIRYVETSSSGLAFTTRKSTQTDVIS